MKKKLVMLLLSSFSLAAGLCDTPALDVSQKNASKNNFNSQEQKIAKKIQNVTQIINKEIKQTEDANTTLMQNIKSLQKEQAISESKRVFLLKKQNEVQSIINSINAEIDNE